MASVGYANLIERLALRVRPLHRPASISTAVNRRVDAENGVLFPLGVAIDDTPVGHLEFALRHEGVNLEVIEAALDVIHPESLATHLRVTPTGEHIRRACFLWEWLRGEMLPTDTATGGNYVDMFPSQEYITSVRPRRHPRFRVWDNALGTPDFCPSVRRASLLDVPSLADLLAEAESTLQAVADPELYARALNYLYLSETRGNFAIEREIPSSDKQERFMQILQMAGDPVKADEDWLVGLQNSVVRDDYAKEAGYRNRQNWLEDGSGRLTFLPPPPEALRRAMAGWEAFMGADGRCGDVLIKAACAAFGFVYLHPFMDGNGRLHRFLIHHTLAQAGHLTKGAVLPVSAVILKNIPAYLAVLAAFSRPVTALWDYRRGDPEPLILRNPGSRPYRFFEADREVAFLHDMIRRAVREEIPHELAWLQGYDQAFLRLDRELDLPQKELSALIRMAHSNAGTLSLNRRRQYSYLPISVLDRIEAVVRETFFTPPAEPETTKNV